MVAKLYIMKLKDSPFNDIHKIGITKRPDPELRADEVRDSLIQSGIDGELKVIFCDWFLFAWTIEQLLHIYYKNRNVDMPVTVSGYTEFFDLNTFIVNLALIPFLRVLQFAQFLLVFLFPFFVMGFFGIIELTW